MGATIKKEEATLYKRAKVILEQDIDCQAENRAVILNVVVPVGTMAPTKMLSGAHFFLPQGVTFLIFLEKELLQNSSEGITFVSAECTHLETVASITGGTWHGTSTKFCDWCQSP